MGRTGAGGGDQLKGTMRSSAAAAAVPIAYDIGSPMEDSQEKPCDVSGFSDLSGIASTVDMDQDQGPRRYSGACPGVILDGEQSVLRRHA